MEGKEEEFPPENFDTNADRRLCWELGEECVPVLDKALRARWDLRSHPDGLRSQVEVKTRHLLAPPRPRVRPSPVGGSRGVTSESLGGPEGAGFDRPPTRNEVRRSETSVLDFCLFVLQQLVSSRRDFFFNSRTWSADCAARPDHQFQCASSSVPSRPEPSRTEPCRSGRKVSRSLGAASQLAANG